MPNGKERLASLLTALTERHVDPLDLQSLSAYKKLLAAASVASSQRKGKGSRIKGRDQNQIDKGRDKNKTGDKCNKAKFPQCDTKVSSDKDSCVKSKGVSGNNKINDDEYDDDTKIGDVTKGRAKACYDDSDSDSGGNENSKGYSKRNSSNRETNWLRPSSFCSYVLILVAVLGGVVYHNELHTLNGFAKFWLQWENLDLHAEQCTIEMPPAIQDVFRPPVDCAMCRTVSHIEKIAGISSEYFEERYAYSGRPVVITDGQRNWSASTTFSFAFFKSIYSDDSPVLENFERDCQFFPYQTEFRNLRHVFNMSADRASMRSGEPWYIGWSNCDSSAANILRQHYERPYFLPHVAESSKTDWIFMGTPGYGAHLHIDHVGNPSWQAQIRGRKLWTLEPPPECFFECVPMEVIVEPGDIIVLDTNIWYHKTLIVSQDLSVTIGSEFD